MRVCRVCVYVCVWGRERKQELHPLTLTLSLLLSLSLSRSDSTYNFRLFASFFRDQRQRERDTQQKCREKEGKRSRENVCVGKLTKRRSTFMLPLIGSYYRGAMCVHMCTQRHIYIHTHTHTQTGTAEARRPSCLDCGPPPVRHSELLTLLGIAKSAANGASGDSYMITPLFSSLRSVDFRRISIE